MRKKLFIVGAGASKQIASYPSGVELIDRITRYHICVDPNNNWNYGGSDVRSTIAACNDEKSISNALVLLTGSTISKLYKEAALLSLLIKMHSPRSIDYFIQNLEIYFLKSYEDIASCSEIKRTAEIIVQYIIREIREKTPYVKQKIYFYKILQNLEGKFSHVSMINFNYDLILEDIFSYFVRIRNKENDPFSDDLDYLENVIKNSHMYGSIDDGINFIRVIGEEKREEYKNMFLDADDVYFLGFGFDQMNINNLGLNTISQEIKDAIRPIKQKQTREKNNEFARKMKGKRVYITNYSNKERFSPKINKIISDTFAINSISESGNSSLFLSGLSVGLDDYFSPLEIFISGLSVEEAIEKDFLIF